jgi:hypothetical protein
LGTDADGREHNAIRSGATTVNARTWQVQFRPERSGDIVIFANRTRNQVGAATRNEQLTLRGQRLTINSAVSEWTHWATNEARITVVTNQHANDVWVRMPDGRDVTLTRQGTGSGNRTWSATITNVSFPLLVRASESSTGRAVDAQTTLWEIGGDTGPIGTNQILHVGSPSHANRTVGQQVTFVVETTDDVTAVMIHGSHGSSNWIQSSTRNNVRNTREWVVQVQLNPTIPQNQVDAWFTVEALSGTGTVSAQTSSVRITR